MAYAAPDYREAEPDWVGDPALREGPSRDSVDRAVKAAARRFAPLIAADLTRSLGAAALLETELVEELEIALGEAVHDFRRDCWD